LNKKVIIEKSKKIDNTGSWTTLLMAAEIDCWKTYSDAYKLNQKLDEVVGANFTQAEPM